MTATVFITGATSGIGRQSALSLVHAGHHVVASGRNEAALQEVAEDASAATGRLYPMVLDVTDTDGVAGVESRAQTLLEGRPVDVLVNNAGFSLPGPLELVDDAALRRQFDVNVFGLMEVTRAFLPGMRSRRRGRIVNISSGMGRQTLPLHGAYNASKYAVEALSDALRMEMAPWNVQVLLIEPGTVDTGFADRALEALHRYAHESSPYRDAITQVEQSYARAYGSSPTAETVARQVVEAIESKRPRPRYISWNTLLRVTVLEAIPTRWADEVKRRALGYTAAAQP
ncbi:MAG: SDR family oxidoreductase [Nocardioides sp.]|uniref:SDR family oxidoreductase n=1 Tax=Nocardioides sp. TaxID=35761 RepID=UPI0039E2D6D8